MVEHRSPKPGVVGSSPVAPARKEYVLRKKMKAGEFITQVRQEVAKVTWPSRKEVMLSAIMVFAMVTLAAVFFLMVDAILYNGVQFILGLGS